MILLAVATNIGLFAAAFLLLTPAAVPARGLRTGAIIAGMS